MQPVVKPVVKAFWQPGKCLYTRYNRLSNPLWNGLSNRLTTGCIHNTILTIQPFVKPVVKPIDNRLYRVYKHLPGLTNGCIVYTARCQTDCTTRFDNRLNEQWLFVQHGCQTGCQTRFDNQFDNRLYRVYKHSTGCQTGLTAALTTGCIHDTAVWMFVYTIQPVVSCKRGFSLTGLIVVIWCVGGRSIDDHGASRDVRRGQRAGDTTQSNERFRHLPVSQYFGPIRRHSARPRAQR